MKHGGGPRKISHEDGTSEYESIEPSNLLVSNHFVIIVSCCPSSKSKIKGQDEGQNAKVGHEKVIHASEGQHGRNRIRNFSVPSLSWNQAEIVGRNEGLKRDPDFWGNIFEIFSFFRKLPSLPA